MAKITVVDAGLPDWVAEHLNTTFLDLVKKVNPMVAEGLAPDVPANIRNKLIKEAIANNEWKIYAVEFAEGVYEMAVEGPGFQIVRRVSKKHNHISHEFFELSSKLQGRGIAKSVMEASVKLADKLKITSISLKANLDVGGYAWLRKGFFPNDPSDLIDAIVYNTAFPGEPLFEEFKKLVLKTSPAKLKEFVLTDEFRKYKELFLGVDWKGTADISDDATRAALLGKAGEAERMVKRDIGKPRTANEKILDDMVRHQTYILRYSGSMRNASTTVLQATEGRVNALILRYSVKMEGVNPLSPKGRKLMKEMTDEIAKVRRKAWDDLSAEAQAGAVDYAKLEQDATIKIIDGPFPVSLGLQPLPAQQLALIANAAPFEGRTLKEWLDRNADLDINRIVGNAKVGIMQGETPTQVARRVMGTTALKRRDGEVRKAFRDLESVYLTVTNGINNLVKQELYQQNSDIIDLELYVATLDVRTTLICAGNDGETFKLGTGPIPPLHFRCRSLRVPYISAETLHKRGFDASYEPMLLKEFTKNNDLKAVTSYAQLPRGYKTAYTKWSRGRVRELVGQVPATQNFDQWLRNQSLEFQDEYLGKTKAAIFRQGKISLDRFVTRDGYELTIDELKKLAS